MKISFNKNQSDDLWIPVSDMMSGLMMIFLLIAIIYILSFTEQADEIKQTQERICSDIIDEFRDKQEAWNMTVCEDGLLVSFENDSVFDSGKSTLKDEFKEILDTFFPKFMAIIVKNKKDIQELRIEGHTSSEFASPTKEVAYVNNTNLSQARAFSVMKYVFKLLSNKDKLDWMTKNLTAHGMSSSKLKLNELDLEDKEKSRRVEFRIQTNVQDKLIEELRSSSISP